MLFQEKNSKNKTWRSWDDYVALSFFVSAVLTFSEFLRTKQVVDVSSFFPALLVLSHFQFYKATAGRSFVFKSHFPHFFLFQTLTLVATAFSSARSGLLFMALIPCLAAGQYFSLFSEKREGKDAYKHKGMMLLALCGLSALLFVTLGQKISLRYLDLVDMGCFVFWIFGMSFGILEMYRSFENHDSTIRKDIPGLNKERLFFHDLINHTHGINLYLQQKMALQKGLSVEEVQSLHSEIRLIQALSKDHFGFNHKNLMNNYEYVPFEFAKRSIYGLIQNFLSNKKMKCEYSFEGYLAAESQNENSCLIHYPSFHRILTNLVKNISETHSTRVRFIFSYDDSGFHLEVKNRFLTLQNEKNILDKRLASLILESDTKASSEDSGHGLESINSLCEKEGGSFSFGMENDEWVSRVHLPAVRQNSEVLTKKAA